MSQENIEAFDQRRDHGHTHGLVDASIKRSRRGIRAVSLSLAILGLTAVAQVVVFVATNSIALLRLMELLFEYLTGELKIDPQKCAAALWRDYQRGGRSDQPEFLKDSLPDEPRTKPRRTGPALPKRQARHLVQ